MNQDDMPAPAVVDEEKAVKQEENAVIEYVPPSPSRPAPKPAPANLATRKAAAPDPFAVGVRVLRMAPAWLLFATVCCSGVVLGLGWMRSGGGASAVTHSPRHNDARPAKRAPAADEPGAKAEHASPANSSPAVASAPKTTAANDAPPQAVAPAAQTPAPAAQTPQAPSADAPVADEKQRVETSAQAPDSGGKFTAQVGSFNSQSEANERVSGLRAAGFDAHVAAAELPGSGIWYRVQVGRFAERDGAARTVAALRAKGAAASALVVPLQK